MSNLFQVIQPLHDSLLISNPSNSLSDHSIWLTSFQKALCTLYDNQSISEAILLVNQCLKSRKNLASAWNLLTMLMFLRDDSEQALKVCEVGLQECIKSTGTLWIRPKIDLLNLRWTRLDIESFLYGPKAGLESLQGLFTFYKNMFGKENQDSTNGLNIIRHSRFTSSISSKQTLVCDDNTLSLSLLIEGYLWLKSASLYRELNQYNESESAIKEAEKCIKSLRLCVDSKLFKSDESVYSSLASNDVESNQDSKWNSYSKLVLIFVSDILFEKCLIRLEKVKKPVKAQKDPWIESKSSGIERAKRVLKSQLECEKNNDSDSIQDIMSELMLCNSICKGHMPAQILLGSLYMERQQYDLAEIWLNRSLDGESDLSLLTPFYMNRKAEALMKLSQVMERTNRIERAQSYIMDALRISNQVHSWKNIRTGLFDVISDLSNVSL